MKLLKQNSGMSMVGMVITIIVVIILSAAAFIGSRESINKAGLARYEAIIGDLQEIINVRYSHLNGVLTMEQDNYKPRQIYYMVASGERLDDNHSVQVTGKIADLGTIEPDGLRGTDFFRIVDPEILEALKAGRNYDAKQTYYVTDVGEVFTLPGHYMGDTEENTWYINREKFYITENPDGIEPILGVIESE